jgi:hypothetical protein
MDQVSIHQTRPGASSRQSLSAQRRALEKFLSTERNAQSVCGLGSFFAPPHGLGRLGFLFDIVQRDYKRPGKEAAGTFAIDLALNSFFSYEGRQFQLLVVSRKAIILTYPDKMGAFPTFSAFLLSRARHRESGRQTGLEHKLGKAYQELGDQVGVIMDRLQREGGKSSFSLYNQALRDRRSPIGFYAPDPNKPWNEEPRLNWRMVGDLVKSLGEKRAKEFLQPGFLRDQLPSPVNPLRWSIGLPGDLARCISEKESV